MYKEDLALNNLQWLICHKTQPNQTESTPVFLFLFYLYIYIYIYITHIIINIKLLVHESRFVFDDIIRTDI